MEQLAVNFSEVPLGNSNAKGTKNKKYLQNPEKKSKKMPRNQCFVGTLNFSDEEVTKGEAFFKAFHEKFANKMNKKTTAVFYAGQVENGDKENRPHIQFFLHTPKKTDYVALNKKMWSRAHLDIQRGDNAANMRYCCDKDNKEKPTARYQITFGTPVSDVDRNMSLQGRRTDLEKLVSKCCEAGSLVPAFQENKTLYMQYHRGLQAAVAMHQRINQPKWRELTVRCVIGPAGAGKSRLVRDEACGEVYPVPTPTAAQTKWFDNYKGEKAILFEEFEDSLWSCQYINQICDGYKMEVPVKGAFVPALWTEVWFTSNIHPRGWWKTTDPLILNGFRRRVKDIIEFELPVGGVPQIPFPPSRKRKYHVPDVSDTKT